MADFLPIRARELVPLSALELGQDTKFFQSFKHKVEHKLSNPIVGIESSGVLGDVAVCSGTRAEIYSGKDGAQSKLFSKSKDTVYCASYRSDGKLLAVGNAQGQIMIYDFESKLLLRTFSGHRNAVRSVKFLPNKLNLVSTSDDKTVRLWDVAGECEVTCYEQHGDYVRASAVCPTNQSLFLTGAYDGHLRLFDAQSSECLVTASHGEPIEAVVLLCDGSLAVSAGGNTLKFWDLLSGGVLVHSMICHQKTISCLATTSDSKFIITGSLDHQVKVIRLSDYQVIHSWSFSAAVMSLGISRDKVFAGLSNGSLCLRIRKAKAEKPSASPFGIVLTPAAPTKADLKATPKLPAFSRHLKRFQYRSAFDALFATGDSASIASGITELGRRNGLKAALGDGAGGKLLPWVAKRIAHPKLAPSMMAVSFVLIDSLESEMRSTPARLELSGALMNLQNQILDELDIQSHLLALAGCLETLAIARDLAVSVEALEMN